jgi:hypothetical protein
MTTRQEADAAMALVNDAGSYRALIGLAPLIPAALREALEAAHDEVGWCCSAQSEGLACCVDILLNDPSMYAPEKVEQASRLLEQWRLGPRT